MKKVLITLMIWSMAMTCIGQFILQPLNYPGPGYWPVYISISDSMHVWIGTTHESGLAYSWSAKTNDGGNSWTFDSIPVPGWPYCTSICELDTNTCFFMFTDAEEAGGSIWKTDDGGNNWIRLTTTQFEGGFANFIHVFSADTALAMGDPTEGYFEIQITNDGGTTWNRVPSANIPPPLSGEYGYMNQYSAVDNSIWFATSHGRCYRSSNKGLNWEVTQVVEAEDLIFGLCFSTELKGAFYIQDELNTNMAVTYDGGVTWDSVTVPQGYYMLGMTNVEGFDGGFVYSAWNSSTDIFFTPDMFATTTEIGANLISSGAVSFLNPSTGWLAGGESGNNEIYKFVGILTGFENIDSPLADLLVIPNPSAYTALLQVPQYRHTIPLNVRITDLLGSVVGEFKSIPSEWIKLDPIKYADGLYFIKVSQENEVLGSCKWIIKH